MKPSYPLCNRLTARPFFTLHHRNCPLIGRSRKPEWLYTYLMTFYKDPSRPTGVNNAIFRDTAMPHVLWQLQGTQRPVFEEIPDTHTGKANKVLTNVELIRSGLLSEVEYASAIGDLVNFLVYLAEPIKLQRQRLAPWGVVLHIHFCGRRLVLEERILARCEEINLEHD